ncbi:MAG: chorismate synthase [Eubacterium sp.]|nr:chorismate synthase [Eubacterium sp.]
MAGSVFGKELVMTTWGESHGAGIGVTVDGCPAGLSITEEYIQTYLDRRKPGGRDFATPRQEADRVRILSGIFEGKTMGTPISMMIENTSQRSGDYGNLATTYRPGHADFGYDAKYGFRDYRGGGRSSGRETAGRVAAGAVAARLLEEYGVRVQAYVSAIGPVRCDPSRFDTEEIGRNALAMPDAAAAAEAAEYLKKLMEEQDSSGSEVTCIVTGLPAGIGEPVFDKLDAVLGQAIFSIGAVKAVEIGDGTAVVQARGSVNNDGFYMKEGVVSKHTNHAGGILGGISDGSDILLRASFKPTPSIFREQETVNQDGENVKLSIRGRHDPVIGPRASVVVETMTAFAIADLFLRNRSSRI